MPIVHFDREECGIVVAVPKTGAWGDKAEPGADLAGSGHCAGGEIETGRRATGVQVIPETKNALGLEVGKLVGHHVRGATRGAVVARAGQRRLEKRLGLEVR